MSHESNFEDIHKRIRYYMGHIQERLDIPANNTDISCYDLFGLTPDDATKSTIQQRHIEATERFRGGFDRRYGEISNEIRSILEQAKSILQNPVTRAAYDKWLDRRDKSGQKSHATKISAPVSGIETCRDVEDHDPWQPIDITDDFRLSDEQSIVWIKFDNIKPDEEYRLLTVWYSPDGKQYSSDTQEIPVRPGGWSYYTAHFGIYIRGNRAANLLGRWTVRIHIKKYKNGEFAGSDDRYTYFTIGKKLRERNASSSKTRNWTQAAFLSATLGLLASYLDPELPVAWFALLAVICEVKACLVRRRRWPIIPILTLGMVILLLEVTGFTGAKVWQWINPPKQEHYPNSGSAETASQEHVSLQLQPEYTPDKIDHIKNRVKQESKPPNTQPLQDKPFSIQLGIFRNLEGAKRFQGELTSDGYSATVEPVESRKNLHRVLVNGFHTSQEAVSFAEKSFDQTEDSFIIVHRESAQNARE